MKIIGMVVVAALAADDDGTPAVIIAAHRTADQVSSQQR
jgi:hypothetical protein